jgi:ketosteroid isomerase-like protein
MTTTEDIARTQLSAVFAADWDLLESLYDPDVRYLDPDGELIGRSAVTDRLRGLVAALPESVYSIRHQIGGQHAVVVEWTLAGGGLVLDVATVYETRDGRITAERNYWDNAALVPPGEG